MGVDMAIIRGKVVGNPQYVKNDNVLRCLFMLGLEVKGKQYPMDGKGIEETTNYFTIQTIVEPDLTIRCQTLLDANDEVIVIGDFGFHKGKLKMRAKKISLPEVTESLGIPTA